MVGGFGISLLVSHTVLTFSVKKKKKKIKNCKNLNVIVLLAIGFTAVFLQSRGAH